MGISWLLEIIAYMSDNKSNYAIIFKVTNIYNSFQGVIIFVLLVMKKKVLLLIKNGNSITKLPFEFFHIL